MENKGRLTLIRRKNTRLDPNIENIEIIPKK